jgi:hypothetical protein
MKIAGLLLALFMIAVSLVGIVDIDSALTFRRLYFATPGRFYTAGAIRLAMGLVLILAASRSRWPKTLRAMGAVMCLQAVTGILFGIQRAREIMEWEAMQGTALLRAGAVVAFGCGVLVAFAFIKRPRESRTLTGG